MQTHLSTPPGFNRLRWARDTDRAKGKASTDASETALAASREEAERERQAWESLRVTLESAATSREREAREVAEEQARAVRAWPGSKKT